MTKRIKSTDDIFDWMNDLYVLIQTNNISTAEVRSQTMICGRFLDAMKVQLAVAALGKPIEPVAIGSNRT